MTLACAVTRLVLSLSELRGRESNYAMQLLKTLEKIRLKQYPWCN